MRVIYTDEVDPQKLPDKDKVYFYNGMDCLICAEVFEKIYPLLDDISTRTYRFMFSLQAPVLEMTLRGFLVDKRERERMIQELVQDLRRLEEILNKYALALWGAPLNARSPQQKAEFLYDFARLREITKFDWQKMKSRRTTDRAALEKLRDKYPKIRPIVLTILKIMDVSKQLGTLRSGIDPDGFFRASYMVCGTETGRLSSKKNVFGRGSNAQNWTPKLRVIFTAPEGPMPNREAFEKKTPSKARPIPAVSPRLLEQERLSNSIPAGNPGENQE